MVFKNIPYTWVSISASVLPSRKFPKRLFLDGSFDGKFVPEI